jgi:hypothetical protein
MRKWWNLTILVVLMGTVAAGTASADIFADTLVSSQNVIFFGSGILTGAPDSGGAFLSNTGDPPTLLGNVVLKFSGGLIDGPGADLRVFDCCTTDGISLAGETFDVFVSADNIAYTLIGGFGNGVDNVDIAGLFAGPFYYVKLVNTSRVNSPDIDAIQGFSGAVPEPGSILLLATAAALVIGSLKRTVAKS